MKLELLLFTALMAGSSLVHGQQDDQELKQFLVGTWVAEKPDKYGQQWETTFQADGEFLNRSSLGAWLSGIWDVKAGVLFCRVVEFYPNTAQVNGQTIYLQKPGDRTDRIRILDNNHVQNEDGSVADRQ